MIKRFGFAVLVAIGLTLTGCQDLIDLFGSNDANLKSLSLTEAALVPAFSAQTVSYTAQVAFSVTKATVTATTADSKATVISGTGVNNLNVGDNAIVVAVKAQNGDVRNYTITVTRKAAVKVGVLFPDNSSVRWSVEIAALQATSAGTETSLTIGQASSSTTSADQIVQFSALVGAGMKYILLAAISNQDANWPTALAAAHAAGITVIAYDRPLANTDLYVSFDNNAIGRMQGAWLVGKAPAGKYYFLRGSSNDANADQFAAGALEKISAVAAITILNPNVADQTVANWDPANADAMVAAHLLAQVPDAILTPNDGTAGGAATAIQSSLLTSVQQTALLTKLTGQDGTLPAFKRIYQQRQGMTIVKDIKHLASRSLKICADLAKGTTIAQIATGNAYGIPAFLLTNANEPEAAFVVDGANLEVLARAGSLNNSWAEITAP